MKYSLNDEAGETYQQNYFMNSTDNDYVQTHEKTANSKLQNVMHFFASLPSRLVATLRDKKLRWQLIILFSLYAAYASLIMIRSSLDAALPQMLDDKKQLGKGFNKESAGHLLGFATGFYFGMMKSIR